MLNTKLYKPVSELCWDGFEKFRNYCNSLHPDLSGNDSMNKVMSSFEGSYEDWTNLVKGISNGKNKKFC